MSTHRVSINVTQHGDLDGITTEIVTEIKRQMARRSYEAANELRNAALDVLRGSRSGRRYKVPGTYARQRDKGSGEMRNGVYYTASAPGEPPAARTGNFRIRWQPSAETHGDKFVSKIENDVSVNGYVLGELLEDGTSRMAPRPHHDRIKEKAEPTIYRIYDEPYF